MKLSWEVDGVDIVCDKLEDGLEAGMEDAIEKILENLERDAKDRIAVRPYIFTGQVYEGFDDQTTSAHSSSGISSRFINYAKHAGALEHGVHASEYADGAPPISALMPWVVENLADWNVDTGDGGGSAVKTPTAGDENPDTDNEPKDAGYEPDWTRFHKNGHDDPEQLWLGQNVVVYDDSKNGYVSATVTEINLHGEFTVKFDDGSELHLSWEDGYDERFDRGIVAGEDWNSLTTREQRDIVQSMFDSSVDFKGFDPSEESYVESSVNQYIENLANPHHAKQMAIGLSKIEKDTTIPERGFYSGSSRGGSINLNPSKSGVSTARHELAHSWAILNGFAEVDGRRHVEKHGREDWNVLEQFKKDRKLPWHYEEIGKENWDTEKGDDLPHPTTYFLYNEEDRDGVGVFDDVDHPGFDKWEGYIRERTKKKAAQAKNNISTPDYDPFYTEGRVFDPNGGAAKEGDALKMKLGGTTHEVKLESGVERSSKDSREYEISFSKDGNIRTMGITSSGKIADDRAEFVEYAPNGAKFLKGDSLESVDDLPEDPGFAADSDDPFDWFMEALNRDEWAGMIATESAQERVRSRFYTRSDGYSHIGSQEGIAHFMAVIFDKRDGNANAEDYIVDIYNRSPELIYIAGQTTDFSPEMKNVLEQETGLDFDDLMYDIWRENIA